MVLSERGIGARLNRHFWLIADQGVFAAGNYVTSLLFARWLSPLDFGIFSISFGVYALLGVLQYGALVEPFLILAGRADHNQRRSFLLKATSIQVGASAGVLVLTSFGFIFLPRPIAWTALAAGAGGSVLIMQLLLRRLCFAFFSAKPSALIGAGYCGAVVATAFMLHVQAPMRAYDPWLVMGFWGALGCAGMFALLLIQTEPGPEYRLRVLFAFQRQYAPWSVLGAAASWVRVEGLLLLSTRLIGLEQVAATRAIIVLGNPLAQAVVAMDASWLVGFAEKARTGQTLPVRRILSGILLAVAVAVSAAWALNPYVVQLVYGGRYSDVAWQMPIHWFAIGCIAVEGFIASKYKASRRIFRGYGPHILGAVSSITIGLLITVPVFGQPGIIYAVCLSGVCAVIFCCLALLFDTHAETAPAVRTDASGFISHG